MGRLIEENMIYEKAIFDQNIAYLEDFPKWKIVENNVIL